MRSSFIFSNFCKPGKHSIFVYDPLSDKLYNKIIIVNFKNQPFFPRSLISKALKADPTTKSNKKDKVASLTGDDIFAEKPS